MDFSFIDKNTSVSVTFCSAKCLIPEIDIETQGSFYQTRTSWPVFFYMKETTLRRNVTCCRKDSFLSVWKEQIYFEYHKCRYMNGCYKFMLVI